MTKNEDERFMRLAIEQARIAGRMGEVPIGAVITDGGDKVVSSGYNLREAGNDPTGHAEIIAIKKAGEALGSWRLEGSVLYVTIEPCLMCMGAIILARIKRLVFGARDPKAGAVFSVYEIGDDRRLNHTVEVTEGICAGECSAL
ncbi:MAG TPA: nucleoside deaminase, partial [Thermodesulfobacteriota bacterium]|nr:nucleoside deaminase [Thermodesulfobacteriota bacterium]